MNVINRSIARVLRFIYRLVFRNRIKRIELQKENGKLKYQLEYMKHHFDIAQMKPATGWLREYQLKELNYAMEIIKLANSFEINPFFDAGSLLGAIRHSGFIPFDDDIDLGLIRNEFNKFIDIAKQKFVWIDTSNIKDKSFEEFCDKKISLHKNKYVFIQTPFCIHIYKGTSLLDAMNCEIFPFDYVKEDVSEQNYINFLDQSKGNFSLRHPWKNIFDVYNTILESGKIYSDSPTSRITAGPGHYAFTQYSFLGFRDIEDLYPLKTIRFENEYVPVPKNPEKFVSKNYNSWNDFPDDVGISHSLEVLNNYFKSKGQSIPFKEIY